MLVFVFEVLGESGRPMLSGRMFCPAGLQVSIVGLERALHAYVKDAGQAAPFDLKTVPLATTPMQEQVIKAGKTSMCAPRPHTPTHKPPPNPAPTPTQEKSSRPARSVCAHPTPNLCQLKNVLQY